MTREIQVYKGLARGLFSEDEFRKYMAGLNNNTNSRVAHIS